MLRSHHCLQCSDNCRPHIFSIVRRYILPDTSHTHYRIQPPFPFRHSHRTSMATSHSFHIYSSNILYWYPDDSSHCWILRYPLIDFHRTKFHSSSRTGQIPSWHPRSVFFQLCSARLQANLRQDRSDTLCSPSPSVSLSYDIPHPSP